MEANGLVDGLVRLLLNKIFGHLGVLRPTVDTTGSVFQMM
jgi:hypothetical protein